MENHVTINEIVEMEHEQNREANYMMWHQRVTRNSDLLPHTRDGGGLWVSLPHYERYAREFLERSSVFDVVENRSVPVVDFPNRGLSVSVVDVVPLLKEANIHTTIDTVKNGIYGTGKLASFKVRGRVYVTLKNLDEWAQDLETRITHKKKQRVLNA